MTICIEGFMGCGKCSIGKILSHRLGFPFIDLDEYIAGTVGMSIPEIFSLRGEKAFREIETKCLENILSAQEGDMVIALGGGTPVYNAGLIRKYSGLTIWLEASAGTVMERLKGETGSRPLLKGDTSLVETIMEERRNIYASIADFRLSTDGKDPEHICSEILGNCCKMITK